MSDKDFKVKNKLVVNGLTGGAGPLIANSNKEIDSVAFLTTLQGGTGTTTSPAAGQVLYSAGGTTYNPTSFSSITAAATTKGDLEVYSGSALIRQPIGVNGSFLISDSAESTGMRWTNPSSFSINSSGLVGIGTSSPQYPIHIVGTVDPNGMIIDSYGIVASNIWGRRANGTIAAPTNILNGENMFSITASAWFNGAWSSVKNSIQMQAAETWTSSSQATAIRFNSTIVGSTVPSTRIHIDGNGNVGIGGSSTGSRLQVFGSFSATTKSFLIDHPTKEGKKLQYGSLEGPENGVYVRGTTEENIICLPDYWVGLIDPESITVNLTPFGKSQNVYVEKIENNKVYIGGELEKIFFTVYGERKDVDKLIVEF